MIISPVIQWPFWVYRMLYTLFSDKPIRAVLKTYFSAIGVCLSVLFTTILTLTVLLLKTLGEESNSSNTGNTTFNYGIISNKINESVQKSAVINERIIAENTRAKPKAQRKSTQELLILCKRRIDKLFLNFTKDLAVKLKYEPLFDDMKTLKCFFVSFHLFYICILISLHLWNSAQIFRIF